MLTSGLDRDGWKEFIFFLYYISTDIQKVMMEGIEIHDVITVENKGITFFTFVNNQRAE